MGYMVVYIKSASSKKIHLDSKLDFNWSPIFAQDVHLYIYIFNFVANELLGAKTEEFKSN